MIKTATASQRLKGRMRVARAGAGLEQAKSQESAFRASKAAQVAKAPVAKPEDLSSVPGSQWWKEKMDSCKLSSDLHTCAIPQ